MSAGAEAVHGSVHSDALAHDTHPSHATGRGYLTGFVLSLVLTAVPFWLVMAGPLDSKQVTGIIVMAFAAVQVVVHMIFFLHMNARSEGGWSFLALIFTLIVVVISLTGSLWVMYHLNAMMIPGMHDMSQVP